MGVRTHPLPRPSTGPEPAEHGTRDLITLSAATSSRVHWTKKTELQRDCLFAALFLSNLECCRWRHLFPAEGDLHFKTLIFLNKRRNFFTIGRVARTYHPR